ncbi:hypothetical protein TPHA_0A05810 [Tetrapisispora phaffii CBS 4417]|uniref:Association with the SNF1 complex (ASC) domain-containing protein n=1 Tax=Tetrapisispora phaffii (strain ATCC 24235 / CBS 4417 / NBRC 1672 / NRRL Y-8282 / UCD 70-5) TaxID=1071381 RepID=G8BP27_TETPH|nr:hypothetical protein TPHA_0A05810 [Tetrapisispora phaffii CBS 4417]CCE61655.1 hypothetical protein TPHA_0A05810 [Tetrapisispora phaffii CBS 4417]
MTSNNSTNGTHSANNSAPVKDVSMVDLNNIDENTKNITQSLSQMNIDNPNELEPQPIMRNKSTLIFDDDDEIPPYSNHEEHASDIISDSGDEATHNTNVNYNTSNGQEQSQVDAASQEKMHQPQQRAPQQAQQQQTSNIMVPVDITWQQGGEKVYVTGSFTGWRKMIGLVPVPGQPGVLHVKLQLPPGTHKFRFIVDNELRFSDFLPTATDQMGNFVNYLEAVPRTHPDASLQQTHVANDQDGKLRQDQQQQQLSQQQAQKPAQPQGVTESNKSKKYPRSARSQIAFEIEQEPDDLGDGFTRFREEQPLKAVLEYTQDIPAVFTDPTVMEQYYLTLDQQQNNHQNLAWLTPPQLPPHLENVILNNYSSSSSDNSQNTSGSLPIPNHVVLHHLATSSIKHNTLCVASIVRYKRKYVTQILYAPLQ